MNQFQAADNATPINFVQRNWVIFYGFIHGGGNGEWGLGIGHWESGIGHSNTNSPKLRNRCKA
ncbi:hypothetical protein CV014_26570 [Nostoc sp. CMAA1605]|nr:hypothetical protein [Nostoc sp. CMAA1605]